MYIWVYILYLFNRYNITVILVKSKYIKMSMYNAYTLG